MLPDIQSQADECELAIDAVGVRSLRYPLTIRSGQRTQPTVAMLSMSVGLSARRKGTHMSRFIELLEAQTEPLDPAGFGSLVRKMLVRLGASSGTIELRFPWFVTKTAPVSAVQSRLDHDACWRGGVTEGGQYTFRMSVLVPVTSLCPCSKEISAYGAHNQRSHVRIETELEGEMTLDELVGVAERGASCELYGLLKRPDEKFVTERAYENPKFAEDLVRDVALALRRDSRVRAGVVEVENFESIDRKSVV